MNKELRKKMQQGLCTLPIDWDKFNDTMSRLTGDCSGESYPATDVQVLDVIYGVDPVTKLPRGDYAVYLDKNTSPEIREYIQRNLLTERTPSASVEFDKGDEVFDFIRERNESMDDYTRRIVELTRNKLREKIESESKK